MPYLRLYLPEISIAQKRHIAQRLIDTTLRTFQLGAPDRDQITIQFLSLLRGRQRVECRVEVHCHDVPCERQQAFAEEVTPMLIRSLHLHVKNRLAWLMGTEPKIPPRIHVRFLDLPCNKFSPSEWTVGDAFLSEWERAA
jgi:phenylpyruvate tautomerase PptA (4-oxalocrotonate tautomerase family)